MATAFLGAKIDNLEVRCIGKERDRYGRLVATCWLGMVDLSKWMVMWGFAVEYHRYSNAYDADEKRARDAHIGVWSGPFQMPWDWRAGRVAEGEGN